MRFVRYIVWSVLSACAMGACGHSSDDDTQAPVLPPETPEAPETTLTVTNRQGTPVTRYDLPFGFFSESLIVRSNTKWTARVSDQAAEWLSVSVGSAVTAEVSVAVNTTGEVRTGTLLFETQDGKATVEIPVTQQSGQTIGASPIQDLMLIYDNDSGEPYTRERFRATVATDEENPRWLFDGFLFLTSRFDGKTLAGEPTIASSNKEDWLKLLDFYFGHDSHSVPALDAAIGALKPRVQGPFHRRKVVIMLPDPQDRQTDWGELDGKKLDFSNFEDRIAACKWYVDQLLDHFARREYANIQLAGIYWIKESGSFLPKYLSQVADYIHAKGLDFYWIPYYEAFGFSKWASYGFDRAYYQPNYMTHPEFTRTRLYEACDMAKACGMLMELEFGTHQSLQVNADYVDVYEELGLFKTQSLAYYEASALEYWKEGIAEERAFYERICKLVAARQQAFYQ